MDVWEGRWSRGSEVERRWSHPENISQRSNLQHGIVCSSQVNAWKIQHGRQPCSIMSIAIDFSKMKLKYETPAYHERLVYNVRVGLSAFGEIFLNWFEMLRMANKLLNYYIL